MVGRFNKTTLGLVATDLTKLIFIY